MIQGLLLHGLATLRELVDVYIENKSVSVKEYFGKLLDEKDEKFEIPPSPNSKNPYFVIIDDDSESMSVGLLKPQNSDVSMNAMISSSIDNATLDILGISQAQHLMNRPRALTSSFSSQASIAQPPFSLIADLSKCPEYQQTHNAELVTANCYICFGHYHLNCAGENYDADDDDFFCSSCTSLLESEDIDKDDYREFAEYVHDSVENAKKFMRGMNEKKQRVYAKLSPFCKIATQLMSEEVWQPSLKFQKNDSNA